MKRGSRGDHRRTGPLQTSTSCEWERKELGGWCRNSLETLGDSRGQLPVFSRTAAPFLHQDHLHRWCSCTNSARPWVACSLHFIWDIGGLWVFAHLFSFRHAPVLRLRRQRAEMRGLHLLLTQNSYIRNGRKTRRALFATFFFFNLLNL